MPRLLCNSHGGREEALLFKRIEQCLAILILAHGVRQRRQRVINKAHAPRYFSGRRWSSPGDLDRLHKHAGLEQRLTRTGVEPGRAVAQLFNAQRAPLHVDTVEVGNLQFATG